jgi:8-oxo-dGTP pyrophosphatase MutT (NUDIX family)
MDTNNPYKTISQRTGYQSPWIRVREDEIIRRNGEPGVYSVVEVPHCSVVLPLTAKGTIYLVRLWRYPLERYSWEVPMGRVDAGETPRQAAERELREETGLTSFAWEELGTFSSMNGVSSGYLTAFAALGLSGDPGPRDEEIAELKEMSLGEMYRLIDAGDLFDGESLSAILLAARKGVI